MDTPVQSKTKNSHLGTLVRLTRIQLFPIGIIYHFWPFGISLAMAASAYSTPLGVFLNYTGLFFVASVLLHSAGCIWNDICDVDLDARVERSKNRPLVTGEVPMSEAMALFAGLLLATIYTVSVVNTKSAAVMVLVVPFGMVYPLLKRWTWWPQLGLAIVGSLDCPMTWLSLAPQGHIDPQKMKAVLFMSLGLLCWIIQADTMYAAQDRKGDEIAGVKSTARLFGAQIRLITFLFGAAFIACLVYAGIANGNGWAYFVLGCGVAGAHVLWQVLTWSPDDVESSGLAFKRNHELGFFIMGALVLDTYVF